jgi:glycosyltransferase involved in cell wall biosynthesis
MSDANQTVTILLATLNGAKFLPQQLESYRRQTYSNWELLVSDDGSADGTIELIHDFANSVSQRVTLVHGPRRGHWRNFLSLVHRVTLDDGFFAFSDQDDIWLEQKLEKAVAWLTSVAPETPAVYFTRTILIETSGKVLGLSPLFTRAPSFRNALVQNIGGGNTMVFNRAAQRALAATPADVTVISHDWWTYQLITGIGGVAYYDPRPSVKYRQHGQNLIGSNAGPAARVLRLQAFAGGRFATWSEINIAALNGMRRWLSPASVGTLDRFAGARSASGLRRLHLFWRSGVYRQSILETATLFVGSLLNRI